MRQRQRKLGREATRKGQRPPDPQLPNQSKRLHKTRQNTFEHVLLSLEFTERHSVREGDTHGTRGRPKQATRGRLLGIAKKALNSQLPQSLLVCFFECHDESSCPSDHKTCCSSVHKTLSPSATAENATVELKRTVDGRTLPRRKLPWSCLQRIATATAPRREPCQPRTLVPARRKGARVKSTRFPQGWLRRPGYHLHFPSAKKLLMI